MFATSFVEIIYRKWHTAKTRRIWQCFGIMGSYWFSRFETTKLMSWQNKKYVELYLSHLLFLFKLFILSSNLINALVWYTRHKLYHGRFQIYYIHWTKNKMYGMVSYILESTTKYFFNIQATGDKVTVSVLMLI